MRESYAQQLVVLAQSLVNGGFRWYVVSENQVNERTEFFFFFVFYLFRRMEHALIAKTRKFTKLHTATDRVQN